MTKLLLHHPMGHDRQMRCNEAGAAGDQDFFMHFRAFDITEDYNPVLVKRFNDARGNPVFRRRSQ